MEATFVPGNEENNNKSTALCRQTTTRWTPTTEQIRILKDLYYNTGIRSPSAEQIQKISAKLRHYGKIEGKNVFYWFQNHKARERQKKRLISTTNTHDHTRTPPSALWRSEDHSSFYNKCPNFTSPTVPAGGGGGGPSASSFSPGGMIHADGQFGKFGNYGSYAHVDNGFWGGGHGGGGGGGIHNLGWTAVGVDPYYNQYYPSTAYNFLDKNTLDEEEQQQQHEEDQEDSSGLMETLPLFPIHGEEVSGSFWKQESTSGGNYNNNWYMQGADGGNMSCSRASLELTLNSYGCSNWSG